MNLEVNVELKGKLFTLKGAPLRDAVHNAVKTLVEMGEQRLVQLLKPRPGGVYLVPTPRGAIWGGPGHSRPGQGSVGHYRRNLQAKVDGLYGRIDDGDVIYGAWLEGTSSRNQTTRFKGYSMWRKTEQYLQKAAPQVLGRFIDRAIKELNA